MHAIDTGCRRSAIVPSLFLLRMETCVPFPSLLHSGKESIGVLLRHVPNEFARLHLLLERRAFALRRSYASLRHGSRPLSFELTRLFLPQCAAAGKPASASDLKPVHRTPAPLRSGRRPATRQTPQGADIAPAPSGESATEGGACRLRRPAAARPPRP